MYGRAGKRICKTGKSLTEWGYVINTAILASINKLTSQTKTHFFKNLSPSTHNMGIDHYKHLNPLLPPNSFALKCTALIIASPVKDADRTGEESHWTAMTFGNFFSPRLMLTPWPSPCISKQEKAMKSYQPPSTWFVFIISRLPQSFPFYNY